MLKYMEISGKIRKHYEKFLEELKDFDNWTKDAEDLWSDFEKMKFTLT